MIIAKSVCFANLPARKSDSSHFSVKLLSDFGKKKWLFTEICKMMNAEFRIWKSPHSVRAAPVGLPAACSSEQAPQFVRTLGQALPLISLHLFRREVASDHGLEKGDERCEVPQVNSFRADLFMDTHVVIVR